MFLLRVLPPLHAARHRHLLLLLGDLTSPRRVCADTNRLLAFRLDTTFLLTFRLDTTFLPAFHLHPTFLPAFRLHTTHLPARLPHTHHLLARFPPASHLLTRHLMYTPCLPAFSPRDSPQVGSRCVCYSGIEFMIRFN